MITFFEIEDLVLKIFNSNIVQLINTKQNYSLNVQNQKKINLN